MKRLDILVFEQCITESRTIAQNLIVGGAITVDGKIVKKPSERISETSQIKLIGELPKYVGRGGYKLETAVNAFGIRFDGMVCLDIGASTGGFTDCMLQNGAEKVYAVDVGKNQLNVKLKNDKRVCSFEQTDARTAELPEKVDFITVDVSFISLKLIIPVLKRFLKPGAAVCALIKPQFEAGKTRIKKGVLKDRKKQNEIVKDISLFIETLNYEIIGYKKSNISGADGNDEFLIYFKCSQNTGDMKYNLKKEAGVYKSGFIL